MAPRWDLSLLQFIVKRVVIIREDQTILERQVMMREKDLCVFHTADFTMKMSNLLTSDYSDFCTYQLCSFSSAQQPQDNITMEVLIFIFANGCNLQMNDLIFKSAVLQKTHQGILYCFWLTSSRAH